MCVVLKTYKLLELVFSFKLSPRCTRSAPDKSIDRYIKARSRSRETEIMEKYHGDGHDGFLAVDVTAPHVKFAPGLQGKRRSTTKKYPTTIY